MLRKLDRHFFASAFVPYLFSVAACIGLFLVIDILSGMGRISRATSAGTPPMDIVVYYLVRLPGMFVSTFPFTHSLAITFAALSVIRRREGAISMSAGMSMRRVLAPLLAAGVL
ncbi:MAG: LptF/LptG family permease, partial [Candidatus Brocadiia bacterium]